MGLTVKQWLFIAGAAGLFALLYFLPRTSGSPRVEKAAAGAKRSADHTHSPVLTGPAKEAMAVLDPKIQSATGQAKVALLDSAIAILSETYTFFAAAERSQLAAQLEPTSQRWTQSGGLFLDAARVQKEGREDAFAHARECFEKALQKDPENLDAKVKLGVCWVEGSQEPMKGIALIREVLAKDSLHFNANLQLGFFSVKSGQYEKAIDRFKKVLLADPKFYKANLYLADLMENQGDLKSAVRYYNEFIASTDDEVLRAEVKTYVEQLKSKTI